MYVLSVYRPDRVCVFPPLVNDKAYRIERRRKMSATMSISRREKKKAMVRFYTSDSGQCQSLSESFVSSSFPFLHDFLVLTTIMVQGYTIFGVLSHKRISRENTRGKGYGTNFLRNRKKNETFFFQVSSSRQHDVYLESQWPL